MKKMVYLKESRILGEMVTGTTNFFLVGVTKNLSVATINSLTMQRESIQELGWNDGKNKRKAFHDLNLDSRWTTSRKSYFAFVLAHCAVPE